MIWVQLTSLLSSCLAILCQFPVTLQNYTPPYQATMTWVVTKCCPQSSYTANLSTLVSSSDETTTVTSTSTIYVTIYSKSTGNWTRNIIPRTAEPALPGGYKSTH